jgi:hypothetical protein
MPKLIRIWSAGEVGSAGKATGGSRFIIFLAVSSCPVR